MATANSPIRAVCVTARGAPPQPAWADEWVVVPDPPDFAKALTEAHRIGPSIKVDDDDEYADDHDRIMGWWTPGVVVLNVCRVYTCGGRYLGKAPFLSGAVIPPGIEFQTDEHGRIRDSVLGQARVRQADVGTRKVYCSSMWLWNDPPPHRCGHE